MRKKARLFLAFGLFFSIFVLGESCRHAMVRYPQAPPEACRIYPSSKECKKALELRAAHQEQGGEVYKVHQTYYFFGLYPGNLVLDTATYCPEGPKSVHQYTSFWNAFWEQLTLSIYSPQTVEIECYR
ncbi:hypothetical protein EHO59_05805 [Leptospira semungkisensis]|uniref:Uncharacterized protein n=1 Tax=Leptospira semungkisensis TaxID=2484985 RepID=A0A4V3JD06_9LEPT|nr:hypothetical protein [Leptospira semungkisensis]TGK08049.1 hypothetical protein EHO59_05805 [Leptospira semungkisensis]